MVGLTRRFQVSTNRTGLHRTIQVRLYDDPSALLAAFRRAHPDEPDQPGYETGAFFVTPDDWEDCDPRASVGGTMHLPAGADLVLIVHEATHAAMHIYSIDGYRQHARATAHLTAWNETVPYLVGDIVGKIVGWMHAHDLQVTVGDPHAYGDTLRPPRIPRDTPL